MLSKTIIFLHILRLCFCDWVSDWMNPVQDEFGIVTKNVRLTTSEHVKSTVNSKDINARRNDEELKLFEDEELRTAPALEPFRLPQGKVSGEGGPDAEGYSASGLKSKLQATLDNARTVAAALRAQILVLTSRETALKEAIANGRSGVTSLLVHTLDRSPRSYIIRDGSWILCNGALQPPYHDPYSKMTPVPRCLGLETPSKPDPCIFNSVVKYETVPIRRRMEYVEDDYLCLKSSFNTTIEQYLSVPRRLVNDTCTNGIVRSLQENVAECGLRILAEYTYYPGAGAVPPREYCPGGTCPLLAAWHVSNVTIENFEFLKEEPGFKKFFIRSTYERII